MARKLLWCCRGRNWWNSVFINFLAVGPPGCWENHSQVGASYGEWPSLRGHAEDSHQPLGLAGCCSLQEQALGKVWAPQEPSDRENQMCRTRIRKFILLTIVSFVLTCYHCNLAGIRSLSHCCSFRRWVLERFREVEWLVKDQIAQQRLN